MLTPEQREQFLNERFIVLKGVCPPEDSVAWVREECAHAGYGLDNSETWTKEYACLPTQRQEKLSDYAPKARDAACDLMVSRGQKAHQLSQGPWGGL